MKFHWKVAISVVPLVAGYFLWPYLERTPSHIALCATGLALALAWYSILDLQAQRHERFVPHTLDRLLRATITAITLVFVFNFAWPSNAQPVESVEDGPSPEVRVETRTLRFIDDLNTLVAANTLDQASLDLVVDAHFTKVSGRGRVEFHFGDGRILLLQAQDVVRAKWAP